MRKAVRSALVLLLLSIPLQVIASEAVVVDDPQGLAPRAISSGRYHESLDSQDVRDSFTLKGAGNAIVRIEFESTAQVEATLVTATSLGTWTGGAGKLAAFAPAGADPRLEFALTGTAGSPTSYSFTYIPEFHDHYIPLDGGKALAAAWAVSAPSEFMRIELNVGTDPKGASAAGEVFIAREVGPEFCTATFGHRVGWAAHDVSFGSINRADGRQVALVGEGLSVEATVHHPTIPDPIALGVGMRRAHAWEGMPEGSTIEFSLARASPLGHVGWVVWDGPSNGVRSVASRAVYGTLADHSRGDRAHVGPLGTASNAMLELSVLASDPASRVLVVDATDFVGGTGPTEIEVRAPDGSTTSLVNSRALLRTFSPWGSSATIPTGDWTFKLTSGSVLEGNYPRVTYVAAPVSQECAG